METNEQLSFEDTAIAFAYKSNAELKKAHFIFSSVKTKLLAKLGTNLVKISFSLGLPIKGLIKKTVFGHFCGGESIEGSLPTIEKLAHYNVGTILDYSVEGLHNEEGFEATTNEIIRTIENARSNSNIPFCAFKVTGIASVNILTKLQDEETLTNEEVKAYDKFSIRFERLCKTAYECDTQLLVDAEDSWYQDPIDSITYQMMERYNKEKAIVFNTYQMYRKQSLENLRVAFKDAAKNQYYLGAKLVRGAYMEKRKG